MQEDIFAAAEKILSDIENVFKKDLDLISFEIIPIEDNQNKSPVLHDNNSLGLASWCIRPLFCYVYNHLFDLKLNQCRREQPTVVSRWLLGALLLNPDVLTFWNMKREFIRNGRLDPMEELRFVGVILNYKAKCLEAFSYRRWILKLLLLENKNRAPNLESLLRNEFKVSSMAANRYANNYHAWNHRKYVVSMMETLAVDEFDSVLEEEWEESTRWCSCHVSDYSGFDYRQFLLRRLLLRGRPNDQPGSSAEVAEQRRNIVVEFVRRAARDREDGLSALDDNSHEDNLSVLHGANFTRTSDPAHERTLVNLSYWAEDCIINERLLLTFPGHEALWYHRRFLLFSLLALNDSYRSCLLYKIECLDSFRLARRASQTKATDNINTLATSPDNSKSLLESALKLRNKDLINAAKRSRIEQGNLAEKFFAFLVFMKSHP